MLALRLEVRSGQVNTNSRKRCNMPRRSDDAAVRGAAARSASSRRAFSETKKIAPPRAERLPRATIAASASDRAVDVGVARAQVDQPGGQQRLGQTRSIGANPPSMTTSIWMTAPAARHPGDFGRRAVAMPLRVRNDGHQSARR